MPSENKHPLMTVNLSNGAVVEVELYPESAPNSVNSVIHAANTGFYDGKEIQRVVPGLAIQVTYNPGGLIPGDYRIAGEFASVGFQNGIPNVTGCVAMAGDGEKFCSGTSFYFTLADVPRLNGNYSCIGKVVSGWDHIEKIAASELMPLPSPEGRPDVKVNKPVVPVIMERIRVETYGVNYPEPIKLEI